jgi:hypothetical protein
MHGDATVSSWKALFVLLLMAVVLGLLVAGLVWLVRALQAGQ